MVRVRDCLSEMDPASAALQWASPIHRGCIQFLIQMHCGIWMETTR